MSQILSELDNIYREYDAPLNVAMSSIYILAAYKGINLKVLKMPEGAMATYFALASVTNAVQANALVEQIIQFAKKFKLAIFSVEGEGDSDWRLIDLGDVIVHIFKESARHFYGLEELWQDAQSVDIPESYYQADEQNNSWGNYF